MPFRTSRHWFCKRPRHYARISVEASAYIRVWKGFGGDAYEENNGGLILSHGIKIISFPYLGNPVLGPVKFYLLSSVIGAPQVLLASNQSGPSRLLTYTYIRATFRATHGVQIGQTIDRMRDIFIQSMKRYFNVL